MRKFLMTVTCFSFLLVGCKPLVDTMNDSSATSSSAQSEVMESEAMEPKKAMQGAIVNGYMHYEEGVLTNGQTKVLFFHASWCPYCKEKDENLRDWYATEQVPLNTYRIDFDTETELKQRYGITVQDTFVVADGSGKAIATLTSPSLGDLKRVLYGNMDKVMDTESEDTMMKDEVIMEQEESSQAVETSGTFTVYREGVIGNGSPAVLFFHAQWCPYCIANEKRLNGWYGSEEIQISTYKVDFDTAAELKQQFGVVQQDTYILIDGSGNEVSRLSFPSEAALRALLG